MSKELTPLEALKQMSAYHLEMGITVRDLPNYEIIETALKDYERVEGSVCIAKSIGLDICRKRDKALEIIKEKEVNLIKLKSSASYEEYEIAYILDHPRGNHITKQEYDLLKEVLECKRD